MFLVLVSVGSSDAPFSVPILKPGGFSYGNLFIRKGQRLFRSQ